MRACIFASGSSGNCLLLSEGGTNILIDAGISMRRVLCGLAQAETSMDNIGGVLITHEHSDHISGLKVLSKNYSFPVYAPKTVASHLRGLLPQLEGRLHTIPVGKSFKIGGLAVTAFHTSHDTDESVGYRVCGSGSFAVATDTGCVTDEMSTVLKGTEAVLLESNHDDEMLRYGPYPVYLKRRILSERGHLSNDCCAAFARSLAESGTEKIILGHLSRTNNSPRLAMKTAEKALQGLGTGLFCAPELGFLEVHTGEDI
ncbi:MAG: MBL fold metallo-hydrolase [Candidatus Limivicinus sp.]|jgi:phosphoribosyl 1,2-cyclic phosphodiesterase